MNEAAPEIDVETGITEISIGVDGCVYVFGLSRQVLDVLATLAPNDPRVNRLRGVPCLAPALAPGIPAQGPGLNEDPRNTYPTFRR